jgi:hypothetical protein
MATVTSGQPWTSHHQQLLYPSKANAIQSQFLELFHDTRLVGTEFTLTMIQRLANTGIKMHRRNAEEVL